MPQNDLHIVFEDKYLLLCVKPVGVLSEDSESGASMPRLLCAHYSALRQPNYIATVHRLDKITGGLMIFSRRREVTGKLIAAVAAHQVEKEYLAVLRGHPEEKEAELTDLLFRDAAKNKSYVVKRMRKGVREAKLSPDPGAVCLPGSAPAGGHSLWQQGPEMHRLPLVIPAGTDPPPHR